ncbi:hypothetical protein F8568_009930 [Actinomadura sp. LD22]|uniref:Uncharacterized protein n=1 Tax=Actinomadura physcomitrii TaxID=2650748 RepID=A0A6I4M6S7_9ACTN|nr:hypothetical protein [Actinomadura physcomitrii]MWA00690.1 hypothetical protein [Actinomadura physcomitrii]
MAEPMRWRGGAIVPSTMWSSGNLKVTWPFCALTLNDSRIVLKAAWKRFVFTPANVAEVYPCQTGWLSGIGILTPGGRVLIFLTHQPHAVLTALEAAGFPTSAEDPGFYGYIR